MTYQNRFGQYAVKIGNATYKWFKDRDKAITCFNWYSEAPEELDDVLRLVEIKTGKVLMECEAIREVDT